MELMAMDMLPDAPDPRMVAEIEQKARAELQARLVLPSVSTLPPDPLNASDADLELCGLPPRPDRTLHPGLFDVWQDMLRPPLRPVAPEFVAQALAMRQVAHGGSGTTTLGAIAHAYGRWGTSRNWSGAVLTAHGRRRFRIVTASWVVPKVRLPHGASPSKPPPGGAWQVSHWIGLDGFRRFSLSLPQVGTVSRLGISKGPQPPAGTLVEETYLFVQWWVRDKDYGEIRVPQMQVRPGDVIHAMLSLRGDTNVSFHVTNRTTGRMLNIAWAPGTYVLPPSLRLNQPLRTGAPAEGINAVFCVERPGIPPAPGASLNPELIEKYRLPAFDFVPFDRVHALMLGPGEPPLIADLTGARWLRMCGSDMTGRPTGTRIETTPDAPAPVAQAFTVRTPG
jgi:hypothetical protein